MRMSAEQKYHAIRLRNVGHSYTKIGELLGLPAETVKSYCRRTVTSAPAPENTICLNCGKPLFRMPKQKPRRFCSAYCRSVYLNHHADRRTTPANHIRPCPQCGELYKVYSTTPRKYCSHECYVRARFYNRGEAECNE